MVPTRQQIIIIGHNVREDLQVLDIFDIRLEEFFDVTGVVDTQVLIEDTSDDTTPENLAALVLK